MYKTPENNSIKKAFQILEAYSKAGKTELGPTEISKLTNINKTTVVRFLLTLEEIDILERTPNNKYTLGLKLYELGNRIILKNFLIEKARDVIEDLHWALNESINLAVLKFDKVVFIDSCFSERKFELFKKFVVGSSFPAYTSAAGKCILANLPEEKLLKIVSQYSFKKLTKKTISNKKMFFECLKKVKEEGYAVDDEENEIGVRCIGAPIFAPYGENVLAAVSVTGSVENINENSIKEYVPLIKKAAKKITNNLDSFDGYFTKFIQKYYN